MAIPSDQLDIWAKQGSIDLSSTTYQSIRNALTDTNSPILEQITSGKIKITLQGSYANDTNTRGDSDVDVLVVLDTFHSNKLALPRDQYLLHEQTYPVAQYGWSDLRRDVTAALKSYYGAGFVDDTGNKSIKVLKNSGRLNADIVPVVVYRNYTYFLSDANHEKSEGVLFYHRTTNEEIVNFPDQHYSNGVAKHQATSNTFKRIVRIIKNARTHAVEKNILAKDATPSYFLQSMIYNVPDAAFAGNDQTALYNVLSHLTQNDIHGYITQSEQHALFGTTGIHWNHADAMTTISALTHLWNNWNNI